MPTVVRRFAISFALSLVLLGAGEVLFRSRLPACGESPFRNAEGSDLAVEFRPNFETEYKGQLVRFNSLGFRGDEFPAREPDVLRIALVGDSFTFGTAVADGDTLAARLQQSLARLGRRAQVLNLGVPGYTSTDVASVVEHKALALDPDLLVYVFYANDVDAPIDWGPIPAGTRIDEYHGLPLRSAMLAWGSVRLKQLAGRCGTSWARRSAESSRQQYLGAGGQRVRAAVERMRAACRAREVGFCVAVYPHMTFTELNPFRPIDELALADFERLGVPAVDLLESFEGELDLTRYWADVFDHHPNGAANGLAGALLARRLLELAR